MLAGQVIDGACVSLIVTVNEQLGPAVVVHVTVVVPFGKKEPAGGVHVTVPQLPVVVGAVKLTTAPHWFGSLLWATLAGHVIVQLSSLTIVPVAEPSPIVAFTGAVRFTVKASSGSLTMSPTTPTVTVCV